VIEVNRLLAAMIAYAVLGVLVWTTIQDQRIRLVASAILLMFALKTWVRRKEVLHPDKGSDGE
jgi:uncharacterized membrane protein YfcA